MIYLCNNSETFNINFGKIFNDTLNNKLFNHASAESQLYLIKYLCEQTDAKCPENAINLAGMNNSIDIVKYLHEKFGYQCSVFILNNAIDNNYHELVKYIAMTHNIYYSEKILNYSILFNDVIFKKLYSIYEYNLPINIIDVAAEHGNYDIVKFLHQRYFKPSNIALDMASMNGYLDIVKYLIEHCECKYSTNTMDFAVRNDHKEIVKYLVNKNVPYSKNSLIAISQSNNLEMFKILCVNNMKHYRNDGTNLLDQI
jgi:ankyrin repeat protein